MLYVYTKVLLRYLLSLTILSSVFSVYCVATRVFLCAATKKRRFQLGGLEAFLVGPKRLEALIEI